jgi:hypothetical protein
MRGVKAASSYCSISRSAAWPSAENPMTSTPNVVDSFCAIAWTHITKIKLAGNFFIEVSSVSAMTLFQFIVCALCCTSTRPENLCVSRRIEQHY